MARLVRSILLFGALGALGGAGCGGDEEEKESAPPVETEPQETADDCVGGTAPVITAMELENTGLDRFDEGTYPTLTVWVTVEDEDWDLASYQLDVWYDTTEDQSVEQDSDKHFESVGTLSQDGDCTAPGGTVGLKIGLAGGGIEYDALTEFGAIVTDTNGVASEMATVAGYTPTAEGEDGGP